MQDKKMETWFVDQVLNVFNSNVQCVRLVKLPLDTANKKKELAEKIDVELDLLEFKYNGIPPNNSIELDYYRIEQFTRTGNLFRVYHELTRLSGDEKIKVFRNRNLKIGDTLDYIS